MIKIRTLYIVLPLTILMAVGCYLKGWTAGIALWALLALVCVGRILRERKEKNGAKDAQNNAPCAKKAGEHPSGSSPALLPFPLSQCRAGPTVSTYSSAAGLPSSSEMSRQTVCALLHGAQA